MSQASDDPNPYQPTSDTPGVPLTGDKVARSVREMGRWQTFLAALLTIGTIAAIGMFVVTMSLQAAATGAVCLASGALLIYGLPAIMLWKAARGAQRFAQTAETQQWTEFVAAQLAFWRTVGIMAVLVLGAYLIIFLIAGATQLVR